MVINRTRFSAQGLNSVQHLWQSDKNFLIGKTYDAISKIAQECIAFRIESVMLFVNSAVDFNDKPCFGAVEIYYESIDYLLPTEFETAQLQFS